jgi:BNR repeat-like domain
LHTQKALAAFWFAGTRERCADVEIFSSTYDCHTQTLDALQRVVNLHTVGKDLCIQIRRIGDPVETSDTQSRLHLFVVATGRGDWAASLFAHLT